MCVFSLKRRGLLARNGEGGSGSFAGRYAPLRRFSNPIFPKLSTMGRREEHVKEQTTGPSGRTRKSSKYLERRRHNRFSGRGARG